MTIDIFLVRSDGRVEQRYCDYTPSDSFQKIIGVHVEVQFEGVIQLPAIISKA